MTLEIFLGCQVTLLLLHSHCFQVVLSHQSKEMYVYVPTLVYTYIYKYVCVYPSSYQAKHEYVLMSALLIQHQMDYSSLLPLFVCNRPLQ